MARLAEYMADMADLLGEKAAVHFVQVEGGSAVLVQDVEHEAYPKVRARVHDVKRGEGSPDARRAYEALNKRLAADNASGKLIEDPAPHEQGGIPARVLVFPGRRKFVEIEYGPVGHIATLQGVVIVVGGESDPVPVHLEDGDDVYLCKAKRPLAKELAGHIFGSPVRVTGNGRWLRDATGEWIMKTFLITDYSPLKDDSLSTVIAALRQIPGEWKTRRDGAAVLRAIRTDES